MSQRLVLQTVDIAGPIAATIARVRRQRGLALGNDEVDVLVCEITFAVSKVLRPAVAALSQKETAALAGERMRAGILELAAGQVISYSKAANLLGCTVRDVRKALRDYPAEAKRQQEQQT